MKRFLCFTIFLMLFSLLMTSKSRDDIRNLRYRKIDFYHFAVGMESSANLNFNLSPKILVGIGSYRNLLNCAVGAKYVMTNQPPIFNERKYSQHSTSVFASARINAIRWGMNSVFVMGEAAYNMSILSGVAPKGAETLEYDKNIGRNHFSAKTDLGITLDRLDLSLFCEYDLSPSANQKYVYENQAYDYYKVKGSLFERMRYGISVLYYFRF